MLILLKNKILQSFIVFIFFFIVFCFTISSNFSVSHDSIAYINAIDIGINLFHPHHLLYHIFNFKVLQIARLIDNSFDSAKVVSMVNCFFGALSLVVIFNLFKTRFKIKRNCIIITGICLIAFSYGFWFYSDCIEVYIIPIFFMLLSLYFILDEEETKNIFLSAIFTSLAILFHQSHILLLFSIIIFTLLNYKSKKNIIIYLAICGGIVSTVYLYVLINIIKINSFFDMVNWVTFYMHGSSYWNPISFSTLLKAFIGFSRSIISGNFLFNILDQEQIKIFFRGKSLDDEFFAVMDLGYNKSMFLLFLMISFTLFFVYFIIKYLNYLPHLWRNKRKEVSLLLVSLFVYSLFFFFWDSANVEFWIPQSIFMWLLIILFISEVSNNVKWKTKYYFLLYLLPVILFIINFNGSIKSAINPQKDYYYKKIEYLINKASKDDLIIIVNEWLNKDYIERFIPVVKVIPIFDLNKQVDNKSKIKLLDKEIKNALNTNKKIFLLSEVFYKEERLSLYQKYLNSNYSFEKYHYDGFNDFYLIDGYCK